MLIRRETPADRAAIREVTRLAFRDADRPAAEPVEVALVDDLRADDDAWLPRLSLVAEDAAGQVVGHVLCTRGRVSGHGALALGPISVRPDLQRGGIGTALMHAVLGAADAANEPLVALVGEPAYYRRFGFRPAADYGIKAQVPDWGPYFQVRTLSAYEPSLTGLFTFPAAFPSE